MDSHHRKIDLQSASDLTYLLNNIRTAAQEKIDLAIPRSAAPQGEDAYRTKVEELVQDYILRSLALALPSLTINGFDPSPSLLHTSASGLTTITSNDTTTANPNSSTHDPSNLSDAEIAAGNYEAYDPRLAERLRSLYIQYEQESENVAKMRRTAPQKAARAYAERLRGDMDGQENLGAVKLEEEEEGVGGEEGPGLLGEGVKMEKREEVERMWRRGVEGLEGLGDITGVLARLERAEKAMDVVEGL